MEYVCLAPEQLSAPDFTEKDKASFIWEGQTIDKTSVKGCSNTLAGGEHAIEICVSHPHGRVLHT